MRAAAAIVHAAVTAVEIVGAAGVLAAADVVAVAVGVRAAVVVGIAGVAGVLAAVVEAEEDTNLLCHGSSRITRINEPRN